MRFTRDVLLSCIRAAVETPHIEVCGVLSRPIHPDDLDKPRNEQWTRPVDRLDLLDNVADRPAWRYQVDPDEQLAVWRRLDREGQEPCVTFHSHIEHGPYMSVHDIEGAGDRRMAHLIMSLPGLLVNRAEIHPAAIDCAAFGLWRVQRPGDASSLVNVPIVVVGKNLEQPA